MKSSRWLLIFTFLSASACTHVEMKPVTAPVGTGTPKASVAATAKVTTSKVTTAKTTSFPKASATPAPANGQHNHAAEKVAEDVREIYQRYILNLSSDLGDGWQKDSPPVLKKAFAARKKEKELERTRILQTYLTPTFQAKIRKIVADTDADALTRAQDYGDDWIDHVAVTDVVVSKDRATAVVTLGQNEPHGLFVRTKKLLGVWRIDSVGDRTAYRKNEIDTLTE